MANPRIVWNSNTLDFPELLSDYRPDDAFRGGVHTADGAVTERVRAGRWREAEIAIEPFDDTAFFYALHGWWAWASRGKQYSFAFDSARTVNTTLVNNESAGATVIEVNSTTGFTVNNYYRMRSVDLLSDEIVQVQSISAGVSVTLVAGTKYAYTAGDSIFDPDYYPTVVSADDTRPFFEQAGVLYSLRHRFLEDRA